MLPEPHSSFRDIPSNFSKNQGMSRWSIIDFVKIIAAQFAKCFRHTIFGFQLVSLRTLFSSITHDRQPLFAARADPTVGATTK